MDAGKRIQHAFQSSSADLSAFLQRMRSNATTTLAMMFQNPAVPDARDAAEESIALLLQEAGGHCQDAGLSQSQRELFLNVHRQVVADFRQALSDALVSGVPADDRPALATQIAQSLRLPT
jgi:hypothetical protein